MVSAVPLERPFHRLGVDGHSFLEIVFKSTVTNPPAVAERAVVVLSVAAAVPGKTLARPGAVVAQALVAALHPLLSSRLGRINPARVAFVWQEQRAGSAKVRALADAGSHGKYRKAWK